MRRLLTIAAALLLTLSLFSATLEKLDFDEMVAKSTAIVRGRIGSSYTTTKGSMIYTHYKVQILERWKGVPASEIDIVVPGGSLGSVRQQFSGTPKLAAGAEQVLFLWTGKSGLTHIIGLTQGLFDVKIDANGESIATRAASSETMLDRTTGQPVKDEAIATRLLDLSARISRSVAQGAAR